MSLTVSRRVPDLFVLGGVLNLVRAHEGHEHWRLEDAFTLLAVLVVCSAVYSWRRWRELSRVLREVRTLRGILPICSKCKKIRTDEGYWHNVDEYVRDHTDAQFSHSLCPECAIELYPTMFGPGAKKRESPSGTAGADSG